MKRTVPQNIFHYLRRLCAGREDGDSTDADLLHRFIAYRDEGAFALLLQRHGPMVLAVCRRILGNDADAEDAFQATFLALACKPRAVSSPALVANWLHGVATNVALKARSMNIKRTRKEQQAGEQLVTRTHTPGDDKMDEALDQELGKLPDRYRAVIVLCDLEGSSLREAGEKIGCPAGTVASRLNRGRQLLATRLTRRGITVAGASFAAAAAARTAVAAVPLRLAEATLKAAALPAGPLAAGAVSENVAGLLKAALKGTLVARLQRLGVVAALLLMMGLGMLAMSRAQSVPASGFTAAPGRPVAERLPVARAAQSPPAGGLTAASASRAGEQLLDARVEDMAGLPPADGEEAPMVSAVSPNSGPWKGGTLVTVQGSGFYGGGSSPAVTGVFFGLQAADSFSVSADGVLTVKAPRWDALMTPVAPAGKGQGAAAARGAIIALRSMTMPLQARQVVLTVVTKQGRSSSKFTPGVNVYTYIVPVVATVTPGSGPAAGGTVVTITGTGFHADGKPAVSAVKFGRVDAASYTVNSDTSITATSPAAPGNAAGHVVITVTTPAGTSTGLGSGIGKNQFTFVVDIAK